jgi:putative ABC transport system permease protein
MPILSPFVSLWKTLVHKGRLEKDLHDELGAYFELSIEEKIRAGVEPGSARREAAIELGGMEQVKEQVREVMVGSALGGVLQDIRHAIRSMKTNPGSTVLAMLMLTLGIGATTLIFSVFYAVLLQPLPFPQPDRLVQIWETRLQKGWQHASVTEANFWDLRAHNKTFEEMGAFVAGDLNMTGNGEPEHVDVGRVSAGFFRLLGVNPVMGRGFFPDEDQPSRQNQVVLLENKFWKTQFGADPHIVGRTLRLDGRPYVVVGVLPSGEPWLNDASVFLPLVQRTNTDRGAFELSVVGRLRPHVSARMAAADLQTVCRWLAEQYPHQDGGMGVTMTSAARWGADQKITSALRVLLAAVAVLLLIACVNLANLLLAKATARGREMTIRAVLGASRGRILRLVMIESVLLGLIGGGLGLVFTGAGLSAIKAANLADIPRIGDVQLNVWVLLFTLAIACSTGLLSGLVPALQLRYSDMAIALRDGDRSQMGSRSQMRLRSLLVMLEVALSLMLLVGAGLLIRSFSELLHTGRGFQSENRLLFAVNLPSAYDADRASLITNRLLASVGSLPQVISAAASNTRPITGWDPGMGIVAAGTSEAASQASAANVPWASWRLVSSSYFKTMGTPLLKGKAFSERDKFGRPGRVVINERLAEMLWPGQNPVGRQAVLWKGQSNHVTEIIGIVADMRERRLDSNPIPIVYIPGNGSGYSPVEFVVHTRVDPLSIVPLLRKRLSEIDPGLPISNVKTFDEVISDSLGPKRLNMAALAVFAATALLLAMAGIYGVLAYSVTRRIPEIGLRVVLGATRRSIVGLIVKQGMPPILLGIVIGLAAALALSRFLETLLFGITPADPVTYIAAALLVACTAMVSCCVPAIRAARTDPASALRQE